MKHYLFGRNEESHSKHYKLATNKTCRSEPVWLKVKRVLEKGSEISKGKYVCTPNWEGSAPTYMEGYSS
ncbi:MAG: hypothetical protein ABSA92_03810 [Candidatus Bathyarchaeia archaeon]